MKYNNSGLYMVSRGTYNNFIRLRRNIEHIKYNNFGQFMVSPGTYNNFILKAFL